MAYLLGTTGQKAIKLKSRTAEEHQKTAHKELVQQSYLLKSDPSDESAPRYNIDALCIRDFARGRQHTISGELATTDPASVVQQMSHLALDLLPKNKDLIWLIGAMNLLAGQLQGQPKQLWTRAQVYDRSNPPVVVQQSLWTFSAHLVLQTPPFGARLRSTSPKNVHLVRTGDLFMHRPDTTYTVLDPTGVKVLYLDTPEYLVTPLMEKHIYSRPPEFPPAPALSTSPSLSDHAISPLPIQPEPVLTSADGPDPLVAEPSAGASKAPPPPSQSLTPAVPSQVTSAASILPAPPSKRLVPYSSSPIPSPLRADTLALAPNRAQLATTAKARHLVEPEPNSLPSHPSRPETPQQQIRVRKFDDIRSRQTDAQSPSRRSPPTKAARVADGPLAAVDGPDVERRADEEDGEDVRMEEGPAGTELMAKLKAAVAGQGSEYPPA